MNWSCEQQSFVSLSIRGGCATAAIPQIAMSYHTFGTNETFRPKPDAGVSKARHYNLPGDASSPVRDNPDPDYQVFTASDP
jgi:hypothetical protein